MAKARVYELAKELGVGNKEILEQLKKKNVEVKNHMSTGEDNVAEEIRRENAGRNEEPAKAEPAAEKAGEKDSTVPKKKNLAFVVRPQNSRNSSRLQGNKRPGANQGRGAAQGNACRREPSGTCSRCRGKTGAYRESGSGRYASGEN